MKVAFIEPAAPGFHVYSFVKQLRLGLPLLGALLTERGHEVRIYVETLGDVDWDEVLSSDLVGISTITSTAIRAYRYAQRARDAGIPTVMGGPHVTFLADEALDYCDYVVRGEGEETLLELIEVLQGHREPSSILGLSYRGEDGVNVHNPDRPLRKTLTDLPWPDLSLVDHNDKIKPTPIMASRGCPYGCEFCSVIQMFGRRVRTTDPVETIKEIKRAKPHKLFFYDDNFFISKRWGMELLTLMVKEQLNVPFFAQIRVDSVCKNGKVDRDLLDLMWNAGCRIVYLGIESINPATLKEYKKEASVDDIYGGVAALRERGIRTHGMFVFGADSDTVESLLETADFAVDAGLNTAQFLILTPLPGTPQTAQLEREGRIFTKNWSLYDGFHVVSWPKQMTPWELQQVMMEATARFYRPGRIRPPSHKHRIEGYLLSRGWEHVRENRGYLRELKDFSESQMPPFSVYEGLPVELPKVAS